MNDYERRGWTFSALAHLLLLIITITGLPSLLSPERNNEPMVITVELLPITGVTNVKPKSRPKKEIAPPEKKQTEQPKPTPPVKTQDAPPPPPKEVVSVKPTEEKPKPKPKEDVKPKDKPKEKEDDLDAVLKAVQKTAEQQEEKKEDTSQVAEDESDKANNSESYDPSKPLSLSEEDAIRSQISKCWNVPAGAKDAHELLIVLRIALTQDGSVTKVELAKASEDRYSRDSFFKAAADSAIRAVRKCSPLKNLPPDKYSTWRDMELTFDPREMLF